LASSSSTMMRSGKRSNCPSCDRRTRMRQGGNRPDRTARLPEDVRGREDSVGFPGVTPSPGAAPPPSAPLAPPTPRPSS
jgi:hypothetical protein